MTRKQFFWFGRVLLVIAVAVVDKMGMASKLASIASIQALRKDLFAMEGD